MQGHSSGYVIAHFHELPIKEREQCYHPGRGICPKHGASGASHHPPAVAWIESRDVV